LPNSGKDDELWSPINVVDNIVSPAKCRFSAMPKNSTFCYGAVISEEITMVKWFPGINMYKALGMAAKSGMEDVLRLLILAGNDIKFLERNVTLSRIMSKMEIS
jgi:hypothetical protein